MSTLQWCGADVAALSALWETTALAGVWAWQSREGKRLELLVVDADFLSENPSLYLAARNLSMTRGDSTIPSLNRRLI